MASKPCTYLAAASDMDGTLLRPDHCLSDLCRRAITAMNRRNIYFFIATGRPHSDVRITARKMNLQAYLVTSNGARVHDPEGKVLLRCDLEPSLVKSLVDIGVGNSVVATSIYQEDHWYMNKHAEDLCEYYQNNKDEFYYEIFDPAVHANYEGVYKVYYTAPLDKLDVLGELAEHIRTTYGDTVSAYFALPHCFEVTAAGVNKGSTLAKLLKHLHPADPRSGEELLKESITFGDGENDLDMLLMAKKGCVMSNAHKRLLDRLPKDAPSLEFIGSNAEDAVAHRLVQEFHLDE